MRSMTCRSPVAPVGKPCHSGMSPTPKPTPAERRQPMSEACCDFCMERLAEAWDEAVEALDRHYGDLSGLDGIVQDLDRRNPYRTKETP